MAVLKDLIVHGSSRFLNGAQFNTINAESIGATEGIFNKLIATTLEAKEATITDLTAENATVTGLLDVQGQMHTNSWTNANIATIDGNFFITPTIGVAYGAFTYNGTDITVSGVTKDGTTYTFGTDSNWVANSLVMITGQVAGADAMMPLGTIRGKLKSVSSTDRQCATVVITGPFSDGIGGPCTTLENIGTVSGVDAKDIKISLYQKKIDSGLAPLGIYMTSGGMSTQNMSFIDIYNGGNIVSTAPSDANGSSGAFAKPVLRIGNLSHLGTVGGQTVTGYGIYTTNGFFEGVITAKKGYIGGSDGWTISTTDIHSPSAHSSYNSNNDGIYIGKVSSDYYIAGGPQAQWWLKSDGTAKIGDMTLTKVNNVFTLAVPAANITNLSAAAVTAVTGSFSMLSSGVITTNANRTTYNSTVSGLTLDMNGIGAGNGTSNTFKVVASTGVLTATGANITGSITATSFNAYDSNNKLRAKVDLDGLTVYAQDGTTVAANLGKLQDTNNYTATIGRTDGYYIHLTAFGGMFFKSSTKTLGLLSASGLQWYTNETTPQLMAHIGYGNTVLESGTGDRPYYTFGIRTSDSSKGGYSVAEGYDITASGYISHAEGGSSIASGSYSHAEGIVTTASGWSAHAEGGNSIASGSYSHAEGNYTTASGLYSHAGGDHTTASGEAQTVIGRYNESNTSFAFIIGNGHSGTSSTPTVYTNVLTVDWNGNVNIASGAKYKINGTALSAADVSAIALSDKYTRSSAGTVDWSNQTDGEAKIITKSALAYWNGCYSGTSSNLSRCSQGQIIGRNQICYANSRVDTFSSGQITIANSSLGVTTGAKPVGIILTPEYGTAVIMKYNYDSSTATNSVIQCWNHDGTAYSGAMRYFAVVFQNTWTAT